MKPKDRRVQKKPLVSAMMPTYNSAPHLEDAIRSVVHQTLEDWELVIVDDGSTDATPDILRRWADDPRIRVFRLPENRGRGFARNYALQQCRGEYVAICDSDDISLPERFEIQVRYLAKNPEVGVLASQVLYFSDGEAPALRIIQPESDEAIRRRMQLRKSPIPNQSAMMRRELLEDHGGYVEQFRRCQDLEFFLRVRRVTRFRTLPDPLVLYRQSSRDPSFRYWISNAFYESLAFARAAALEKGSETPSRRAFLWKPSSLARLFIREPVAYLFFHLRRRLLQTFATRS